MDDFGLTKEEVVSHQKNGTYSAWDIYNNNEVVRDTLNMLFSGPWADDNVDRFKAIFDEILTKNDEYFVLKDLVSYIDASLRAFKLYEDREHWAEMAIHNIANSGFFSSDRTIKSYVDEIWHLKKLK